MLAKAIAIASEAHKDRTDKGGKPYILHLLRVMFSVDQNDEELMTIAVLHDLIEDCEEWCIENIREEGFSERVCRALFLLNHNNDIPYDDYIKSIAPNEDARKVKLADLKDNSNYLRLKNVTEKSFDSMKKYHAAYIYLSNIINE